MKRLTLRPRSGLTKTSCPLRHWGEMSRVQRSPRCPSARLGVVRHAFVRSSFSNEECWPEVCMCQ